MRTGCTLLIVALYLSLAIIYNGGTETMDSQLFAALITVGVAVAGNIITDIVAIRKENSNYKLLSKEHDDLSKGHNDLSKGHDRLSKECADLAANLSKEHDMLSQSLEKKHSQMMADLKDVRDYTIRTEEAKEEAYKKGIDIKNVMAQIQALAEANADSTMRLKEMQKDLDNCKETIEWQSKIIEDKDEQLNQLRRENKLLQKQIYSLNAQNHAGRDEEEFEL